MAKDVEHFLKCLSASLISSIESSLFSSVPHILIGLFGVLLTSFLSSFYILEISPLSDVGLVKKIFPVCALPFGLVHCVLCLTKASKFEEVPLINC